MRQSRFSFETLRTALAIGIALVIALITILLVSEEPAVALQAFLLGPLKSVRHFGNVVEMMIPLMFTGLAISVMFSSAQFNLGGEGAFFFGAVTTAFVAIRLPLPPILHPAVAILAGGVVGSIFCGLPGLMKVRWGASELVSSLMFNYLSMFLGLFLINYFLRDVQAGAMVSERLPESIVLTQFIPRTRIHMGLLIAIACNIGVYFFLYRTRWGYRIRITGQNEKFAQYAGVKTASVVIGAQLIGGFIAGVGGSVELLGMYRRFSWQALPGYGWDGVIVAILARLNPAFVPLAAFFLAYLRIGADLMARTSDVQSEFVAIIQGVMIVLIAASGFLEKYRHRIVYRDALKEVNHG